MTILIIYQFSGGQGHNIAAFRRELLKLDKYKGWMSDDDDGECLALPETVVVSLSTDEEDARQDFEAQLDKMKLRDRLHSVIYSSLSAHRLFVSASEVGDGECDWEK
jgi:hypothetical protein